MASGNTPTALKQFRKSRALHKRVGSKRGVAIQNYHIGICLLQQSKNDEALGHFHRARRACQELGDVVLGNRIAIREAEALRALGDNEQARQVLAAIAPPEVAAVPSVDVAHAYEVLAAIAREAAELDDADQYRDQAIAMYRELGHPRADQLSKATDISLAS